MADNFLMDLDIRLGSKENITLSRDEFNRLTRGDYNEVKNLQSEIQDLENEIEYFQENISSLNSQIKKLTEENNKLKGNNNE
jgi:peptidoglycan hydrolase CwlO-like protein